MLNKLKSKVGAVKNVGKKRVSNSEKFQKIKKKCSELYEEYKEEEMKIRKELGLEENESFTLVVIEVNENGERVDHHYRDVGSVEDVRDINMFEMFYIKANDMKLPAVKKEITDDGCEYHDGSCTSCDLDHFDQCIY